MEIYILNQKDSEQIKEITLLIGNSTLKQKEIIRLFLCSLEIWRKNGRLTRFSHITPDEIIEYCKLIEENEIVENLNNLYNASTFLVDSAVSHTNLFSYANNKESEEMSFEIKKEMWKLVYFEDKTLIGLYKTN